MQRLLDRKKKNDFVVSDCALMTMRFTMLCLWPSREFLYHCPHTKQIHVVSKSGDNIGLVWRKMYMHGGKIYMHGVLYNFWGIKWGEFGFLYAYIQDFKFTCI